MVSDIKERARRLKKPEAGSGREAAREMTGKGRVLSTKYSYQAHWMSTMTRIQLSIP